MDQKPDPLNATMQNLMLAASAFFTEATKAYAAELPRDAAAFAVLLASGRAAPGVRLEMSLDGPKVELGYVEGSTFHKFFSFPQPEQQPPAPDTRTIN
ncbi:MAG: hypothetical protein U1A72_17055 [Sulfuritalea sp.]|nr:hypothetical protein [Sulfuritalea sp.]